MESERVPSDQLFRFFSGLGGHDPDEGPDDQRHEPDDLEQVRFDQVRITRVECMGQHVLYLYAAASACFKHVSRVAPAWDL